MRKLGTLISIALLPVTLAAQANPASVAAHAWRTGHEHAIVDELVSLLSVPNLSNDRAAIQQNAVAIAALMTKRGLAPQLISVPGGNPIVFGEIRTPGATRTIALYAHYDGALLDPKEWATPPFTPVLRDRALEDGGKVVSLPSSGSPFDPESRIYARGSADDKAPIIAMLSAIDGIRAAGLKMKSNIKFVFEGEEESGSPNLERTLASNRALFAADLYLMCDSPLHQSRRQSIIFGARGLSLIDITVYGPRNELHSGHYGNWAPNPALMLVNLLASMKDAHDHVLIDHFYDGIEPLSPLEKRAIAEAPKNDAELMKSFWLGATDNAPHTLMELIAVPSLNIRGMASARMGEQASSVIPASATASLDIRLVKGMDRQATEARLIEHVRRQGFFVVDAEPSAEVREAHPKVAKVTIRPGGYNAKRTAMDLPISQEIIRVVESARGPAVKIPTMGGGVPLESIERALGTRTIIIPIGNHDNRQHSFDENLRIQNLWDGIELMAALITM